MNAGNCKVLVGSSGGKMIVYSGKWWERSADKLCSVRSMYKVDSQAVEWCAW